MEKNLIPKLLSSPSAELSSSPNSSNSSNYCIVSAVRESDVLLIENKVDESEDESYRAKSSIQILDDNDPEDFPINLEWMDDKSLLNCLCFENNNKIIEEVIKGDEDKVDKLIEVKSKLDEEDEKEQEKNIKIDEEKAKSEPENTDIVTGSGKLLNHYKRNRPSSCIFVASLSIHMSDEDLHNSVTKCFEAFGNVSFVKVLRDPTLRPYAFVQYYNDTDAKNAMKMGANIILNDRPIRCEPAKINRSILLFPRGTENLDKAASIAVKLILEPYGELEELTEKDLRHDNRTNFSIKYWSAKFAYREDAVRAITVLWRTLGKTQFYKVEWAQNSLDICNRSPDTDYNSIFVKYLNRNITLDDLKERFSQYGNIVTCNIAVRNVRRIAGLPPSPFAFITYDNEKSANDAVHRENNNLFDGCIIHVRFKEIKTVIKSNHLEMKLAPPPLAYIRNLPNIRKPHFRNNFGSRFGDPDLIGNQLGVDFRNDHLSKPLASYNDSRLPPSHVYSGRYRAPNYFNSPGKTYTTVNHSEEWRRSQGDHWESNKQRSYIWKHKDYAEREEISYNTENSSEKIVSTGSHQPATLVIGSKVAGKYQYRVSSDFHPAKHGKGENDENEVANRYRYSKNRGGFNRLRSKLTETDM